MIEQHLTQMRADERTLFNSILKRGKVLEHYGRLEEALACYLDVLQQLKPVIYEARQRLEEEKSLNIGEFIDQENGNEEGKVMGAKNGDDGRGEGELKLDVNDNNLDEEVEDDDDEWWYDDRTKVAVMWRRVRDLLAIEHIALFHLGSIHYQLKARNEQPDTSGSKIIEYAQKEAEYYEAAKLVRKEVRTIISTHVLLLTLHSYLRRRRAKPRSSLINVN